MSNYLVIAIQESEVLNSVKLKKMLLCVFISNSVPKVCYPEMLLFLRRKTHESAAKMDISESGRAELEICLIILDGALLDGAT